MRQPLANKNRLRTLLKKGCHTKLFLSVCLYIYLCNQLELSVIRAVQSTIYRRNSLDQ